MAQTDDEKAVAIAEKTAGAYDEAVEKAAAEVPDYATVEGVIALLDETAANPASEAIKTPPTKSTKSTKAKAS